MPLTRAFLVVAAALLAAAPGSGPAHAQNWPARPLTLVVPWGAGGGTDVMGRIMARRMSEIMGQQVIVENITGAGGMIGVNIQAIPYRGSGPAMQDLIRGQFDYFCTISGSAAAPLQNGLIKGIAAFRHERLPSLPDVPTAYEQGMDFEASTWFGFFVP